MIKRLVMVLVMCLMLFGCVSGSFNTIPSQTQYSIRHYEKGIYTGRSNVYEHRDRIHIRTYNKKGKLESTSEGRK